jgi:hypothetical protein
LVEALDCCTELRLLELNKEVAGHKLVLVGKSWADENFIEYLESRKIKFKELCAYHIGEISKEFSTPMTMSNRQIAELISPLESKERQKIRTYINGAENTKILIFSKRIGGSLTNFGVYIPILNTNRSGFRNGVLTKFMVMNTLQGRDLVTRLGLDNISPNRLQQRTAGSELSPLRRRFGCIGVGSVGSNLIHFLNTIEQPEFSLIDSDILTVENVERHLLGIEFVGEPKVDGIRNLLTGNRPTQKVLTKQKSVLEILRSEPEFLNDCTYLFVATGNSTVENWIGQNLTNGTLACPTFFLSVEPYLAAGHCVYIHPTSLGYDSFIDSHSYFVNHLIDKREFDLGNPLLSKKEAGCQTAYTPYDSTSLLEFISTIFPVINEIIRNDVKQSKSFTWIGNVDLVKKLGLKVTERGECNRGELIIFTG